MVKKAMDYDAALAKAAAVCSRGEHAEAEIRRKVMQWGASADDADRVVDWLVDNNFVDNTRYAHAFVYDKTRFDMWGRTKIRHMLRQNGVSSATIEEAMEEIDETIYLSNLKTLLTAKARTVNTEDAYKSKASLMRYAASRGYEPGLIVPLVASLVNGAEDFDISDE